MPRVRSSTSTSKDLIQFVGLEFAKRADPRKAPEMAAYMKTEMPFYGIQKPERLPIYKEMVKRFPAQTADQYRQHVLALWQQPHREEKYAAIEYACCFKQFINNDALDLYESLIREGAWWDFVDFIAINLVGEVLLKERKLTKPKINGWIGDGDMWVRRSALIAHNHHRQETDEKQLFKHCLLTAHEQEFFIRKAIGWALREYSYANPQAVRLFILENQNKLSPLSVKEGAKQLLRQGRIKPAELNC